MSSLVDRIANSPKALAFLSTFLHLAEICVAAGIAILIAYLFPEYRTQIAALLFGLIEGSIKFLRADQSNDIPDIVNDLTTPSPTETQTEQ